MLAPKKYSQNHNAVQGEAPVINVFALCSGILLTSLSPHDKGDGVPNPHLNSQSTTPGGPRVDTAFSTNVDTRYNGCAAAS